MDAKERDFRTRVTTLLGIALTSNFDGEQRNALWAIRRELSLNSKTFYDICWPPEQAQPKADEPPQETTTSKHQTAEDRAFCELAGEILTSPFFDELNEKDRAFAAQMGTRWRRSVSEKQRAWLESIAEKLERIAAKEAA